MASQRRAFEHVTVSVWLAQMRWMWHEARQVVCALVRSVRQSPLNAKLTHVSDVSIMILSLSATYWEHDALHCCSIKAGFR